MDTHQELPHGSPEVRVWEEKAEKVPQISTGVEKTNRIKLDRAIKESLKGKEVAGDIKKKRKQEGKGTEIREIRRKAEEKGETEAVEERGTQRSAEQKVVST